MTNHIRCPHCRAEFAVTEAVAAQLKDELESTLEQRLACERPHLLEELRAGVAQELSERDVALAELRSRLQQSQTNELELRKERWQLDEQRRELELTVQRTLDAERAQVQERIRREADEDYRLKLAEKDKQAEEMRRQIDELQRKAAPVPAQTQGEVLEQDLELLLRTHFPQDELLPVPAAHHGGDLIQRVRDEAGRDCGAILWEFKRTKNWQPAWLPKLRDDQRLAKARLAVIVSQELPRDSADFGCIDGIYVARRASAAGLAAVLRLALIGVAAAERSVQNRHGKAEQLLAYVCGNDFALRIQGLVEALNSLSVDLDKERRTIERLWAKRAKQLTLALTSASCFQGDLAAIVGGDLRAEEGLELAAEPDAA